MSVVVATGMGIANLTVNVDMTEMIVKNEIIAKNDAKMLK